MNQDDNSKTKPNSDSVSSNYLFKVIIGGVIGSLLAKFLPVSLIARTFGMSTANFIVSCIVIALLVAILMQLKKNSICAIQPKSDLKIGKDPTPKNDAT